MSPGTSRGGAVNLSDYQMRRTAVGGVNKTAPDIKKINEIQFGGGASMDWQEKYFSSLENNISEMKRAVQETKEDIRRDLTHSMTELRDRDNQRHQEILAVMQHQDTKMLEIQQQIIAVNERVDNKLGSLTAEIKNADRWVKGLVISVVALVITAIISFGSLTTGVLNFLTTLSKVPK